MSTTDQQSTLLPLLRTAFQREIEETVPKIYFEDLTDSEMAAMALLFRQAYARVQDDERTPAAVLKLVVKR